MLPTQDFLHLPSSYRIPTQVAVLGFTRLTGYVEIKISRQIEAAVFVYEYVGREGLATAGGWLGPSSVASRVVSSFTLIFEPSAGGVYGGT